MDSAVIYIGLSQALFSALLITLKRPLQIADVILAIWLIAIASMFGLNIYQEVNHIEGDSWFVSLNLLMTYPPLLFLYTRYITVKFEKFKRTDLLHGIPIFISVLLIVFFSLKTDGNPAVELHWLRDIIGYLFIASLWIYGSLALIIVTKFKHQLKNNYSYHSSKINLTWLMVVIISYIIVFNITVLVSTLSESGILSIDADQVRNPMLLVYVYVIGIWGYRQNQLAADAVKLNISKKIITKSPSEKYQKSGLRPEQAKGYLDKLVTFMNQSNTWKDPELSVEKLSIQTDIPKHFITQILNENLGKNFYTFVNEYRTAYAKKLIIDPEYQPWSFVGIAYECGFNSKTAFNTFFKKDMGMTPSEYKHKYLIGVL